MKNGYYTRPELVREVKTVIANHHHLKPADIKIKFESPWKLHKFPTGLVQKFANIVISAAGFIPVHKTIAQNQSRKWYIS